MHFPSVDSPNPREDFEFVVNDSAYFRITQGRQIDLWIGENANAKLVSDSLVGTAFAILMYQRGTWPIHVSAIRAGGGVWLFSGASGEGKSTLAAWLATTHGWSVLSDDAGVLSWFEGRLLFSPGARNLKLLPPSLPLVDQNRAGENTGADSEGKIHFRLPALPQSGPSPVAGFVSLASADSHSASRFESLGGWQALQATRASLYRPWFGRNLCSPEAALKFCAELSKAIPIYRFERPRSHDDFAVHARPLVDRIREVSGV